MLGQRYIDVGQQCNCGGEGVDEAERACRCHGNRKPNREPKPMTSTGPCMHAWVSAAISAATTAAGEPARSGQALPTLERASVTAAALRGR